MRRGRIDELGDLSKLNTDAMFGDRTGKFPHVEYARTGFEKQAPYYRELIEEYHFQDLGRIIDLGGAFGRWAVFLAEVNDHVTVLDTLPYLVDMGPRVARHFDLDNIDYLVGSTEEVPFPDHSFDAAWMHGVIFLTNRDKTLSEIRRLLRPGGRAFMGAFNGVGKMFQKMCHGYERGGFEDLLCKQGLAGLKLGPLAGGPPNFGTRASLDAIFAPFGMKVEYQYPIKDFRGNYKLEPKYAMLFEDTSGMALSFETDESFRNELVANHKHIMRGVEFDLWFSVRKSD